MEHCIERSRSLHQILDFQLDQGNERRSVHKHPTRHTFYTRDDTRKGEGEVKVKMEDGEMREGGRKYNVEAIKARKGKEKRKDTGDK